MFLGCGYRFDGSSYYPESGFTGSLAQVQAFDGVLDPAVIANMALNDPRGTKVMPLGDSITDGYNVPGGYRIKLWADIDGRRQACELRGIAVQWPTIASRQGQ